MFLNTETTELLISIFVLILTSKYTLDYKYIYGEFIQKGINKIALVLYKAC